MSELLTNKITPATGTAITLGDSGDTLTVPSGATLAVAGAATVGTSLAVAGTATVGGAAVVTTAPGTSGNVLTSTGSAWASSAAAGGGGILQMICHQDGLRASDNTGTGLSDTAYQSGAIWTAMTTTITPSATSSYIYYSGDFGICANNGYGAQLWVTFDHAGISETPMQGDLGQRPVGARIENSIATSDMFAPISASGMFAPNTTNAITVRIRTGVSNTANGGVFFHQPTGGQTDTNDGASPMSSFMVWEVAGSISPAITNAQINS